MQCLLVLCHPAKDSLNATLAGAAATALRGNGHDVQVRNLYEQDFRPALSADELKGFATNAASEATRAETAELQAAEILVLVFPTWWFSFPAMLKGWFDRVWAPGIAYDVVTETRALLPRLTGLRHCVAITTLGSPWWVDRLVLWQPVRRVLKTAILRTSAPQARFDFISFYDCEKLTPELVGVMKARVAAALRHL